MHLKKYYLKNLILKNNILLLIIIMNSEILLMTWTISPAKNLNYQSASLSPEIRKLQYFKSLIFYITQSNFNKIVFCENSDYHFSKWETDVLENLSKLYNKKIELLHFLWNFGKTIKQWYWYWEWECIDYAIDNSKLIDNNESFYKITWRYIFWNINQIIDLHKNIKNLFIRHIMLWYFSMNTAFFKMEKRLYKKYFYNLKEMINCGNCIEILFYHVLLKNNLYQYNNKLKVLPNRINSSDSIFTKWLQYYNIIAREGKRYDTILTTLWIYTISWFEKYLYPIITPLTRKK